MRLQPLRKQYRGPPRCHSGVLRWRGRGSQHRSKLLPAAADRWLATRLALVVESGLPGRVISTRTGKLPRRHLKKLQQLVRIWARAPFLGAGASRSHHRELTMGYSRHSLKRPLGAALVTMLVRGAIADASTGDAAVSPSGGQRSASDSDMTLQLDEVIVTASKRAEKLREVADSVTAFSGTELSQIGAQSFADYIGRTPGVIFQKANPSLSHVTIRGVGTTTFGPDQGQV